MRNKQKTQWVSGINLCRAGLLGHFRNSPWKENADKVWLDSRKYKRFLRAIKKAMR